MPTSPTDNDAAVVFRPAAERFHSQLDWLDSWHTFSFANHVDPAWMGFGPLRVINDDTIAAGRGFGMHPHQNMEIITVMVEGQLNHRDSMGHAEVLRSGEVQRMSAGSGVVHSEINAGDRPCRLLQIWIEPSRRGLAPAYEQQHFDVGPQWTPLLDPERQHGAMAIERPVRLWRAKPQAGQRLSAVLQPSSLGWLQVISGSGALLLPANANPMALTQGDGIGFRASAGAAADVEAGDQGADLLLFELH